MDLWSSFADIFGKVEKSGVNGYLTLKDQVREAVILEFYVKHVKILNLDSKKSLYLPAVLGTTSARS